MIKIENLNKYYESSGSKFHALTDINLTLPDQGMIYVVGKSGSGKSTLLNIIGGIDKYDSGNITINNTTFASEDDILAETDPETGAKIKTTEIQTSTFKRKDFNSYRNGYIGFIFQEFNVIKGLTVFENIALSLQLQKISVKENKQKILDIIEKVGLKGKEKRRINELSGGERQRVAIARALIKDPKIIIADEPTGNLDSKNRDIVMDTLKSLSKDKLILIVTHDKYLASRYGDREITIKDGHIINDVTLHPENLKQIVPTNHDLKPISPKSIVSLDLAWKGFKLNLIRFIFIIILFSLSLVFAGSVINLYFTNTTKEYANFQQEYGNIAVTLSETYEYAGKTKTTAFYTYNLSEAKKVFKNGEEGMSTFTSMTTNIPIIKEDYQQFDFFENSIDYLTVYNKTVWENAISNKEIEFAQGESNMNMDNYQVYITDYLADNIINNLACDETCIESDNATFNYTSTSYKNLIGKKIRIPGCTNYFSINGVIKTNYKELVDKFSEDVKYKYAYEDNLPWYNSIIIEESVYKKYFTAANINYYYDSIIYENGEEFNNVKFTKISSSDTIMSNNNGEQLGYYPIAPVNDEDPIIAGVSRGFLEKVLHINASAVAYGDSSAGSYFTSGNADHPGYLVSGGYMKYVYLCGYERVPQNLSFAISCVIDTDDIVIYMPIPGDSTLYQASINATFTNGGFLLALISNNTETNANVYDNVLDNEITINNKSFRKLQLVDNFISDNLILFAILFFSFCLFSILMIFNFVIINIKNSTRDIGIYMSLGMNGWKISLIYLFQVLIISTIACVVGLTGSGILLKVIDDVFTSQAKDATGIEIAFKILKYQPLGVIAILVLAYIVPISAIISPLLSLSRRKPVDVIKVS